MMRTELSASGLCISCGEPNDTETQRCSSCRAELNASVQTMRAERARSGHCVSCGGPNDTETRRCSSCRAEHNALKRAKKAERAASGKCTSCGSSPPRPGKLMCESCAHAERARKKRSSDSVNTQTV
ncbi:MAG: hypothetical protein F4Z55_09465 [Boseongicola sp. SB0667_bin_21]|nr:hypothetical protein [Boseongicola sp. SB0667_bin_21]